MPGVLQAQVYTIEGDPSSATMHEEVNADVCGEDEVFLALEYDQPVLHGSAVVMGSDEGGPDREPVPVVSKYQAPLGATTQGGWAGKKFKLAA